MLLRSPVAAVCVVLIAGCTINKPPDGAGEGSTTGGEVLTDGAEVTGSPPETSGLADPTTPTSPTGIGSQTAPDTGDVDSGDPSDTDPGDPSDTDPGDPSDTDPDDTEGDTEGDDCDANGYVPNPEGEPHFYEMLDGWDQSGFAPVDCPWNPDACSDQPIPGLVSALAIRNDRLPVPFDFLPGSARWLVWSNVASSCDDPFGAPLCAGEWRVAWASSSADWCNFIHTNWGGGWGVENGRPYLLEVGDEGCNTSAFTISAADGSYAEMRFPNDGPDSYGAPQPGVVCSFCALPGDLVLLNGTFEASVCPE